MSKRKRRGHGGASTTAAPSSEASRASEQDRPRDELVPPPRQPSTGDAHASASAPVFEATSRSSAPPTDADGPPEATSVDTDREELDAARASGEVDRGTIEPRHDVAEVSAWVQGVDVDGELEADDLESPEPEPRTFEDLASELRKVEAEVDRMFDERARRGRREDDPSRPRSMVDRLREIVPVELPGQDGTLVDAARDVLSTDYYLRQWSRIGLRNRSEEVDEFGLDPVYEARLRPVLDFLYRTWFRVDVHGIENVPTDGRCILVANHSGVLPFDGLMVRTAVRREQPAARDVRWLAEDFVYHLPFLGAFINRIGAVRACQENAERLLRREECILVFPEGVKGTGKLYKDRYKLQRFGRGGFVKLALRTRAPVIPVSIVGAEETSPLLYRFEYLTRAIGLPFVPITPTFPALGPVGLVPAPSKWTIEFGAPITLDGHGPEAADDALLVGRLSERVRGAIQQSLDARIAARKSVFRG
jgi:1-acyl-sn-glycerol-3-phosphate acyltransferase